MGGRALKAVRNLKFEYFAGQLDYSAQWAEYYRSLGMHDQAAMIEQQARANQQGGQPTQAVAPTPGAQVLWAYSTCTSNHFDGTFFFVKSFGSYGQQQPQYGAYGQPAGGYQYPHQY